VDQIKEFAEKYEFLMFHNFTENPVDYHIIVPHSLYNNNLFCTFRKRVDALKSLQMFCLFYHRSAGR
jgi:hypothetical protein